MTVSRFIVRHPWWSGAAAVAAAALGAVLVVSAGLVPIKASTGHWPITERVLQYAMRRAVATQSLLAPPVPRDLESVEMVARGAAHYELGCRFCHGAPGNSVPPVPQAMTPHPPPLSERVPRLAARELFFIVKHGVKFTGMPAWPVATRDDEVWSMVSFLRRLPEVSVDEYRLLAGLASDATADDGDPQQLPEVVIERCAPCHGRDGNGRGGAFPRLAGQRVGYLRLAMDAYADGRRLSGTMRIVAASLSREERAATARHYASLPPLGAAVAVTESARRGAHIAEAGIEAQNIPSCNTCHGADADVNASYPRLPGQPAWYIVRQLELLQARARGGSAFVHIMDPIAAQLSEAQIRDVAEYYAALP